MSTDTPPNKLNKADKVIADKHTTPVTLIDFMAGIAFLGYAVNKFEDIHIPEGSTLGAEVSRESYAWAKAMLEAKNNA
jgi:hypothetical protein